MYESKTEKVDNVVIMYFELRPRCQSTSVLVSNQQSIFSLPAPRPLLSTPPPQPSALTNHRGLGLDKKVRNTHSLLYLIWRLRSPNGYLAYKQYSSFASSQREVTYSCGTCGYDLNLSSSRRNASTIGSKYSKSVRKGIITFFSVDHNKFNEVEEFGCVPYFISKHSWGLFRRKTKLLCPKCGNHIGNAYSYPLIPKSTSSPSGSEIFNPRKYDIRIRSLQPSAELGTPSVL
ncbi:unnamed protein product [Fraxinus pennsylvanica]|uniref:Uncharacterized protein n=1 Tax=Fraxinus pennsylvanica TaxID=56036 RepID=A0AAD2DJR1_9LAMI|nr:unnamed protein product [Fraxinus pennsylvanica]